MKRIFSINRWIARFAALFAVVNAAQSFAAAELNPADVEFFEKKIRPILVDKCYSCHSAQSEKLKGGLRLDTRDAVLKGGDSGTPAIVAGDPEKSLLIKAVRYNDDKLQMPPKNKKLSSGQIADLEAWVKMGAPDPRTGPVPIAKANAAAEEHWAFKPVHEPRVPEVKNTPWVQTPVDAFILAKLESKGIQPAPKADRRTLIRRVTFDLTGLPPTPEEVADFVADTSSEAFAHVVDRLLASPRYGERWARHWLDVARYADTKGYVFEEERRYPYSYTYRDYVIRAFNEDLPFDRFIIEQIAADRLPLNDDKRPLAALGYLTLGRRFLNNQSDIIDDRIDVVTRGMMGLTVTCARCHDHKFDPIPTKDYYSLYGVFASCSEPADKPLLGVSVPPTEYAQYLAERKKRETELNEFRETKEAEAIQQLRQKTGDYLLAAFDSTRTGDGSRTENLARERKLNPGTVRRWISSLEKWSKDSAHPIFGPWFEFAKLPEKEFEAKAKILALELTANTSSTNRLNPFVALAFAGDAPATMKEVAERYGKVFADVAKRWRETLKLKKEISDGIATTNANRASATIFADSNLESIRQILYGEDSPDNVPQSEIMRLFDVPTGQKVRALKRKLDELDATHPGAPPRAMALQDNASPYQPHVFLRGNPNNQGVEVPRQFLQLLAGKNRKPFENGSGRLELAQAIASRENPLTARVFVNRVWLQDFGAALVRTPSDFGLRCDPPSHPELLDYLAYRFMNDGWSVKKLQRLILLSSAYQESSEFSTVANLQADPANLLLWRMNRRRLDFEAMRDTLLATAGSLDLKAGGRAVEIASMPSAPRRTIYGFIERQNLPGLFRVFDFASPDTTNPRRFITSVPQQALFMLNSPFVIEQARHFVERPEFASIQRPEEKVRRYYQTAFQREPTQKEIELGLHFVHSQESVIPKPAETAVWQYGYGEYDETAKRLKEFHPLRHFTGQSWQGSGKLPDQKVGWVSLNAIGGHPGNQTHAAIRRWTAPSDLTLKITGMLGHDSNEGDGVRARIVSSRSGELGTWTARHGKEKTELAGVEIRQGDTIDFITDCRQDESFDTFEWAPIIQVTGTGSKSDAAKTAKWNAKSDFGGPKEPSQPLKPWEKYAQVLLMSNELVFVD